MTDDQGQLRFGVLDIPDRPYPVLAERWRLLEDLGFDALYTPDHTADYRGLADPLFDGWTTVAAMAARTSRIRVGTLVSNPILRHPVILARQACAVDHLSDGRLELGIGTGIAGFDHAAVGSSYWSPRERAERFAEYVGVVHDVLRSDGRPVSFAGRHYVAQDARAVPPAVQRPHPPITVGGQSPTVLRTAAALADCWNTHGPFGADEHAVLAVTRRQNLLLDEMCTAAGRDPLSLRRSLLLTYSVDAWSSLDALERIVTEFRGVGIQEYVVFWPGDDRRADIERAASEVIPRIRAAAGVQPASADATSGPERHHE